MSSINRVSQKLVMALIINFLDHITFYFGFKSCYTEEIKKNCKAFNEEFIFYQPYLEFAILGEMTD